MAYGRRRPHHSFELGDPFAEGWTARRRWRKGRRPKPRNPYWPTLGPNGAEPHFAPPREAWQWDNGWADADEDLTKNDLDGVTDHDFRYVGVRPKRRVQTEDED